MNVGWRYQEDAASAPGVTDRAFPQLDEIHDERVVLAHVRQALGRRAVVSGCEVRNVWYIPGRSLWVVYRLHGGPPSCGESILAVQFLPDARASADDFRALPHPVAASGILRLAGWNAVGWTFPTDPRLSALPSMLDPSRVAPYFVPRRPGWSSGDPTVLDWAMLSYLPGERCSLRVTDAGTGRTIVGKIHRGDEAVRTHRALSRLWEWPERRFRMPRPLGVDPELGARWETFESGERLEDCFSTIRMDLLVRQVVAAAAALHEAPASDRRSIGPGQVLARLERKVMRRIGAALPALEAECAELVSALTRRAAALPERPVRTIHGDMHAANLLLDRKGVILIDLDDLAAGDPAYDLALFASRLLLLACHRGERVLEVADVVSILPEVYADLGGAPIPSSTYAWYFAALLVSRQIKTCVRHLAPGLQELAPRLLAHARAALGQGPYRLAAG